MWTERHTKTSPLQATSVLQYIQLIYTPVLSMKGKELPFCFISLSSSIDLQIFVQYLLLYCDEGREKSMEFAFENFLMRSFLGLKLQSPNR